MKKFVFMLIAALAALFIAAPAYAAPRIELDQDNPAGGDVVTFTVSQSSGAKEVQLVCGPGAAYYPPTNVTYNQTKPVGSEFTLPDPGETTCVAWLLKRGTPIVGTLFWVTA